MKIVCDEKKCTGCLACVVTCLDHHYDGECGDAVSGRKYRRITEESGYTHYVAESCRHCADAPCIAECPMGAIERNADGWVTVDRNVCVGCGICARVCPWEIPQFDAEGKMVKCDGCAGEAYCVKVCPTGALTLEK